MSLKEYNRKRHFNKTAEPEGKEAQSGSKLIFVVQEHHASRLHWDFRLEAGGVLKSWAVPKGPSMNPADKRLAVMVEDHPLAYATFSGTIPEGEYGAGEVSIWDSGTYEPLDDTGQPLAEQAFLREMETGSIRFRMQGKKLQGVFSLRKMDKGEDNWLLIKKKDEFALSRNQTAGIKAQPPAKQGSKTATSPEAGKLKIKNYIRPMLASLHDAPFDDPDWIFEIKWDGYRAIAETGIKQPLLYSRNGRSFETTYPDIYQAIAGIKRPMVLDGEIVALDAGGRPSFQQLQRHLMEPGQTLYYYVFDCLSLDGTSIEHLPLLERKALLQQALPAQPLLQYCDHVRAQGSDFFKVMQQRGLEGMIAKRASSPYVRGSRSKDWLKIKHVLAEEAVIAGYTQPKGARQHFGALVLGAYKNGRLQYLGHTGTGFDKKTLAYLYEQMQPLVQAESPFSGKVPVRNPVTWLEPRLVCHVVYTETTREGLLRHPVFHGLREDKEASEVHVPLKTTQMKDSMRAGRYQVPVSSMDKLYWPAEGISKGDVLNYYNDMWRLMLRYMKGRPQSLRRNPNGIRDAGFFQKEAGDNLPPWVETVRICAESKGEYVNYYLCNNKATLLYLANLGCIEFNPWNARAERPERPDYLVLDLDPSDENTFDQVVETARVIHDILERAGAPAYCKTSGASGLHVYVPLAARYSHEEARGFAEIIATLCQQQLPDFTSLERSLNKRGPNIYIDYMQNKTGQTLACPYSLRPRPGATASAPLHWKEVKPGLSPEQFTIHNMAARAEREGDLFEGILGRGIDLKKCLKKLGA